MVEFQTTNECYNIINNSVKSNIAHYKYSHTMQHDGFNGIMEHKSICNYWSIIVVLLFPQQFSLHNRLRNKIVGVMFAYPRCEGGRSVDFELCLPIDSMNALGNDQMFMDSLL